MCMNTEALLADTEYQYALVVSISTVLSDLIAVFKPFACKGRIF